MKPAAIAMVMLSCVSALSGCSGQSLLPTGSIFGGDEAKPPEAAAAAAGPGATGAAPAIATAPAPPPSDPVSRAFQVGTVSARAVKCGYNFDPAKLKATYFASEQALGTSPEDMAKVEKIFTVANNGVTKAAASQPNYCSETKTKEIKADLTRVLAGDYTPPPKKVVEEEDGGLFSGFSGDGSSGGVKSTLSTANPY